MFSCEVLEGPGDNARIIPNSEQIAAADLPLEHRGAAVPVLPDVFSIPRGVTQQLGVDLFFSLFFVFLNNQFDTAPPSQEVLLLHHSLFEVLFVFIICAVRDKCEIVDSISSVVKVRFSSRYSRRLGCRPARPRAG